MFGNVFTESASGGNGGIMAAKIDSLWFYVFWFMVTSTSTLVGLLLRRNPFIFLSTIQHFCFSHRLHRKRSVDIRVICEILIRCNLNARSLVLESVFRTGKLFIFESLKPTQ